MIFILFVHVSLANVYNFVADGPEEARIIPSDNIYVLKEGASLPDINCICGTCIPDCNVQWLFNDTLISKGSKLHAAKVFRNQTGNYTCRCLYPSTGDEKTQSVEIVVACKQK